MTAFLSWYILITLIGWLTLPLAYHLFPALTDRGFTLARALGLLVWGYVFWLFATLGIAQNDAGGLLLALLVLVGLSGWAYWVDSGRLTVDGDSVDGQRSMIQWLSENIRQVLTTEVLFLAAFALMAMIRANNPEITTAGGEKWMETAFINAILDSPAFPPRDPWLSGYAISYYYFGYVMTAMLARLASTPAPVAHNLMLSLIFALSSVGAYGILYNLLSAYRRSRGEQEQGVLESVGALLAPLFLLIVSNLQGFLESLHSRGIGWRFNPDGTATSPFWSWLDLQVLTEPPGQPLNWVPDEFFWWWRASRVIRDYELNGTVHEIIDEFPFFSYLLGDLHPHVLAMPFNLLAIAVALNIFFGGWRGKIDLFFGELNISRPGFLFISLVLGGLAFLNTWDILPGAALIVFSYALARVRESGWGWERIEDVLLLGFPAGVTAFLLYLPFFAGFDSQAGGILPNFMFVTRGAHLWVMWGTLFIPLFGYLIYEWRTKETANWKAAGFAALGILFFLIAAMFIIGYLGLLIRPELVNGILDAQGRDVGSFIADSLARRWTNIGSLLTLLGLLVPTFAFLFRRDHLVENRPSHIQPSAFLLLLISIGVLLILGPDFLYLRDNFGYRINTVFKFYYQAWIILSIAAAFAVAVMLSRLRGLVATVYAVTIVIVIALGLFYPVFSLPSKTDGFKANNPEQRTLDGSAYLANIMPEDYQAIQFMSLLEDGVVAEAVGGQYSEFARISTFTGLPTVLGWPGHESQWRDAALQGSRRDDIQTLYTTPNWGTAQEIIERYHIRYVYVGPLERSTYPVNEEKFSLFLSPIYQQGNVTIYEVP